MKSDWHSTWEDEAKFNQMVLLSAFYNTRGSNTTNFIVATTTTTEAAAAATETAATDQEIDQLEIQPLDDELLADYLDYDNLLVERVDEAAKKKPQNYANKTSNRSNTFGPKKIVKCVSYLFGKNQIWIKEFVQICAMELLSMELNIPQCLNW